MSNKTVDIQEIVTLIALIATALAILTSLISAITADSNSFWMIALNSGLIALMSTGVVIAMEIIYSLRSRRTLHVIHHS